MPAEQEQSATDRGQVMDGWPMTLMALIVMLLMFAYVAVELIA